MRQFSITYRIYHLRLDLATVEQGLTATGGWIAEEGRFLQRPLGGLRKNLRLPSSLHYAVTSRSAERAHLSVGFGNCQTRFDCIRWMQCESRSGFATSTEQECTGKCQQTTVATPPCAQRSEGASFFATRRAGATAVKIFHKNQDDNFF